MNVGFCSLHCRSPSFVDVMRSTEPAATNRGSPNVSAFVDDYDPHV